MTRRNALAQQLAADPVVTDDAKHVDLANITTLGNAPTADLPDVAITAAGENLTISWDGSNDYRAAHADEFPTVFVANVTKKKVYLVNSTVAFGQSESQSFNVGLSAYGEATDTFSGFLLSTGATSPHWHGHLCVSERPARVKRNA